LWDTPCFDVYHTKLQFWEPNDTKIERWNTQMSVNITTVITELIFSSSFSWWNNGGVDCIRMALWRNRDLSEGPLCVCICFTLLMWGKK
jgi:hypothetical protein